MKTVVAPVVTVDADLKRLAVPWTSVSSPHPVCSIDSKIDTYQLYPCHYAPTLIRSSTNPSSWHTMKRNGSTIHWGPWTPHLNRKSFSCAHTSPKFNRPSNLWWRPMMNNWSYWTHSEIKWAPWRLPCFLFWEKWKASGHWMIFWSMTTRKCRDLHANIHL